MRRLLILFFLFAAACFGQSVVGGGAKIGGSATNYASSGSTSLSIATQTGSNGTAFGNIANGSTSYPLFFIVTNTGSVTANGVSESFTGTNSADFSSLAYSGTIAEPLMNSVNPPTSAQQVVISSYSESGTTVSLVLASAPSPALQANQRVQVIVAVGSGYNGVVRVTPTGSTSLTYTAGTSGLSSGSCTASAPNCTVTIMPYAPCGSSIAAGAVCYVAAQFTPSGTSAESATLNVTSSNASTATKALTGTGVTGTAVSSCGSLSSAGANYYATANLSGTGTCLNITANIASLNLNGHSVTYGTTTTSGSNVYGLEVSATITSAIYNGQIIQGNCLNPSSSSLRNGSTAFDVFAGGVDNATAHDMSLFHCSDSSQAFDIDYGGSSDNGGINMYNVTTTPNVVTAQVRYDFSGYEFRCDTCGNDTVQAIFHDIYMVGVNPQGCFAYNEQKANKYNMYCSVGNPQGTTTSGGTGGNCSYNPWTNAAGTLPVDAGNECSNDFAYGNGDQQTMSNVVVNDQQGRGLFTGASHAFTLSNSIVFASLQYANNYEYNGCEPEGNYGVQFDNNPTNQTLSGTTVNTQAGTCAANGLRVTDSETYTNISENNSYYAHRPAGSSSTCNNGVPNNGTGNCAIGFMTYGPTAFLSENDTFTYDSCGFFLGWSTGQVTNVTLLSPTFNEGSNPDASYFHTFCAATGYGPPAGSGYVHVRDPVFGSGVTATNTDIPAQDTGSHGQALFSIDWTQTVNVVKASGPAATGATVTFTDSHSNTYSCTTTLNGSTSTCVPTNAAYTSYPNTPTQETISNSSGANTIDNGFNPYSLSVSLSSSGCTTYNQSSITISATGTFNITLAGC